ncbi:metallophosphoesterase [Deinococcus peraridilitoris]|uniref:Putative phosphohydrolase n=1 Tax=Deinococcus peraridilitoris (strain DSM 19664 / LMG 22246 / CIP 109416 / KR-200) TaxID=937777 RepID=L0A749_DEIPD|nr:metallophosphoesterase [Deinococcus peraridilitoris]AFZ69012.1 putative phosphohydrolase [Deinococcus peraridilitoris DSM 19664]
MNILAIADLHLSAVHPKPMTVFGRQWHGHPEAIFDRWQDTVQEDDLVLLPGDLSWAMKLDDALVDLEHVAKLPGLKVISRGNHDYWWPSISKLRAQLPRGMFAVQNDALRFGDVAICGTRGWVVPGSDEFSADDERIYKRELERLRLALEAARLTGAPRTVLMLHYPPTSLHFAPTGFTDLIDQYRPEAVVYGHLHGVPIERSLRMWNGIPTHLVAADGLFFRPRRIL